MKRLRNAQLPEGEAVSRLKEPLIVLHVLGAELEVAVPSVYGVSDELIFQQDVHGLADDGVIDSQSGVDKVLELDGKTFNSIHVL